MNRCWGQELLCRPARHCDHVVPLGPLFWTMVLGIVLLCGTMVAADPSGSGGKPVPPKCKYSVRDVAFVNVHGKPWQLQLIKPVDLDPNQFEDWNSVLQARLESTNVGFIWFEPGSPEADRALSTLQQFQGTQGQLPAMVLQEKSGSQWPVSVDDGVSMEQQLEQIVHSPARRKILDQVVEALCVLVLVESKDSSENERARNLATQAMVQIERQMWTLEKPTDRAAALVTVAHDLTPNESWLLSSLGIEEADTPCLAVVYGQGRRLGEVLSGDALSFDKIVGRATICGRDCECDLDRDWLYGQQVIHSWSPERERAAESTLDFDPHSAFVVAEVSQILQKNAKGLAGEPHVDLGGGLVIHDLEPELDGDTNVQEQPTRSIQDTAVPKPQLDEPEPEPEAAGSVVPWPILSVLGLILLGTLVYFWTRLS